MKSINLHTFYQSCGPKTRLAVYLLLIMFTIGFFLAVYTCSGSSCLTQMNVTPAPLTEYEALVQGKVPRHNFSYSDLIKDKKLNLEDEDVLVYLHVQKTGGSTFGKHLVHNLHVEPPCECIPHVKKCTCLTSNNRVWLLSRHSTGWVCGLHADWTELNDCVDEWFRNNDPESRKHRRYHYISIVRNPLERFFSEWQHVRRGATWKTTRLFCHGREASVEEVPFCYDTADWKGVSLDEFLSCKSNLAFNRMTRMMADLTKVNCYNRTGLNESEVNQILVESAKKNLLAFDFFGLVEFQAETQFLFERTFGLQFIENFQQRNTTHVAHLEITDSMKAKALEVNRLDISLYLFAKDLFLQRVRSMEKKLGYSVKEYFSSVRKPVESGEEVFEDADPDENELQKKEYYPTRGYKGT